MTEKALKPIKPFLNYEEQIRNSLNGDYPVYLKFHGTGTGKLTEIVFANSVYPSSQ